ncbi:MAG: RNA methyltransferase [Chloroflexi bacterium]|nr:RNA methyltransferase [Chloroflexota bacterium]
MIDQAHSWLEGRVSAQAAIEAGWREVHQILIDSNKRYDRRLRPLLRGAKAAAAPVSFVPGDVIQQRASGGSHGGVLAAVGERRFCELAELLPAERAAFIVMLDGIEDPYNFAGAVRCLYAAGVDGIVLRPRNWTSAGAIVGRASAGAIERVPLAIAETAASAADFYRAQGLQIAVAAKSENSRAPNKADLTQPTFLLIGGERRGVTRSFAQTADVSLEIAYGREFDQSLGAVAAAAVIAFEVKRQRDSAPAL